MAQLIDIETWVFDLDNTLYPLETSLFPQLNVKMTAYVGKILGVSDTEAEGLRRRYHKEYGTTLAGLMANHKIDPEPYLLDVHDVDMSILSPAPDLAAAIKALPGRKIIYTNGTAPYAEAVTEARGLSGIFEAFYGVVEADYHPKPTAEAFEVVFAKDGLTPERSAMFEDEARNLSVPHALGLTTVYVAPTPLDAPFIHHHCADLTGFLRALV